MQSFSKERFHSFSRTSTFAVKTTASSSHFIVRNVGKDFTSVSKAQTKFMPIPSTLQSFGFVVIDRASLLLRVIPAQSNWGPFLTTWVISEHLGVFSNVHLAKTNMTGLSLFASGLQQKVHHTRSFELQEIASYSQDSVSSRCINITVVNRCTSHNNVCWEMQMT
jgi:hypothetical protein